MDTKTKRPLVILGPTASGKTTLGVALAALLGGEILSADSRQIYRGLDIGSGKDLAEYVVAGRPIPYHLIDIADLTEEFSVFHYQQAFFPAYTAVLKRNALPIIVGGSGLYLESVLEGYNMDFVPENRVLRSQLAGLSDDALRARLAGLGHRPHNTTDLLDRDRLIRAIEIGEHTRTHPAPAHAPMNAFIIGIACDPDVLRERIAERLWARMSAGLIEEVVALHEAGHSWERLALLGLEYRHIAEYLQGKIKNRNDLLQKLNSAIAQFAKRQRTWFRRMERKGFVIHWQPDNSVATTMDTLREEMP